MITNPSTVFVEPFVAKPAAGVCLLDPTFSTRLTRIVLDPGAPLPVGPTTGCWGTLARHTYAKVQPWNSDGSLLAIDNMMNGGAPPRLYLDGKSYQPLYADPVTLSADQRWHPAPGYPQVRIQVPVGGMVLEHYDMVTRQVLSSWALPFPVDGIGSGEGNVSSDGRYVALSENEAGSSHYRLFLVDMVYGLLGPAYDLGGDGVMQAGWGIDWVSVTPSGAYVVVMYSKSGIDCAVRVFDVDPTDLSLTPYPHSTSYPGMYGAPEDGFIYTLGHADLTRDPWDSSEDVLVGVENCGNVGLAVPGMQTPAGKCGQLIKVRLADGKAMSLDDPSNSAGPAHVSCRSLNYPGWAFVSYYYGSKGAVGGARYQDEVVAVKLDRSGSVMRLAHQHSDWSSGGYYAYPMAVPALDGRRVLFASNWSHEGDGDATTYQAYVVGPY